MGNVNIKVNTSELKNETIPQIEKACSNLSKAREELAKIKEKPKDFRYSETLDKIPAQIKQIEYNISDLSTNILRKAKKYEILDKDKEKSGISIGEGVIKLATTAKEQIDKQIQVYKFPPENDIIQVNEKSMTKGQYANFRNVCSGEMAENTLYRSINPIIPYSDKYKEQAYYADRLLEAHKVKIIINLSDTESSINTDAYDKSTYYQELQKSGNVYACRTEDNGDYKSKEKKKDIAEALRPIAENSGPYAIHCKMGQGRTGHAIMILECLEGCDYNYIYEDYTTSFKNANLVGHSTIKKSAYNKQFSKCMEAITGKSPKDYEKPEASDWEGIDLEECAENYLKEGGMTYEEITRIKKNLSK